MEATTLLDRPDGLSEEPAIRRDLQRLYQVHIRNSEVVVHHVVPHALPTQQPPIEIIRPQWTGCRTVMTRDLRCTGSNQGALYSGDLAARDVAD